VEEKTYEFGMLRALGLKQTSLITLLSFQAAIFALPALVLALLMSYLLNILVCFILFDYAGAVTTFALNPYAIMIVIFF
jgi:ABC-type antimicrobial peptide transport system permease subunit